MVLQSYTGAAWKRWGVTTSLRISSLYLLSIATVAAGNNLCYIEDDGKTDAGLNSSLISSHLPSQCWGRTSHILLKFCKRGLDIVFKFLYESGWQKQHERFRIPSLSRSALDNVATRSHDKISARNSKMGGPPLSLLSVSVFRCTTATAGCRISVDLSCYWVNELGFLKSGLFVVKRLCRLTRDHRQIGSPAPNRWIAPAE